MKTRHIKEIPILILFLLFLIILVQQSCGVVNNTKISSDKKQETDVPQNIITITALIFFQTIDNNQQLILIENPESKSRKSYECINLNEDMRKKLLPYNNTKIIAEIKIIKEITPWYLKVELLSFHK